MGKGDNYERLERYNKKELIEKIIVRDKHCNHLKDLLAKGLEKYKLLEKENKELKEELNFYYKAAKQFRKDKDVLMKENEELEKENKELKMKIDTLELCIKNKDELLEEYRKKIDKFRTDIIYEEGLYE